MDEPVFQVLIPMLPSFQAFLCTGLPKFWVALGPGKGGSWKVQCQQPMLWVIPADSTGQGMEENESPCSLLVPAGKIPL